MTSYAQTTVVPTTRSRDEIERLVIRYGATDFAVGWTQTHAVVTFIMEGRQIRINVPLPERADFTHSEGTGRARTTAAVDNAFSQAVRSRWRSLVLIIKAKLEAVAAGVVTFEQEWGMHMVLPTGRTVGEYAVPAIAEAYATGQVPPLLGPTVSRPELSEGQQ